MNDVDPDSEETESEGVLIPWQRLSPEALEGIVEEFVTREGTDYGHSEAGHEEKRAQVLRQLRTGAAVIAFDPDTKTCTLLPAEDARRPQRR